MNFHNFFLPWLLLDSYFEDFLPLPISHYYYALVLNIDSPIQKKIIFLSSIEVLYNMQ